MPYLYALGLICSGRCPLLPRAMDSRCWAVPHGEVLDHNPHTSGNLILDDHGNDIVCFGSFSGVTGECEFTGQDSGMLSIPARLESYKHFTLTAGTHSRGIIYLQHRQILQAILEEPALRLQVSCTLEDVERQKPKRNRNSHRIVPCSLNIILYGPQTLSEELGTFFQSYDIYLQDPHDCDLDVKYCNPHRLSSTDLTSLPMTSEIRLAINYAVLGVPELIPERSELLALLDTKEELVESVQPEALKTSLERHQKQALTFMMQREKGWAFDSSRDIWIRARGSQGHSFVNLISGFHQSKEPPQFLGGIIADPMGLGKTLTMIALVATDLQESDFIDDEFTDDESSNTTLVVVPPPLIDTWEEQLSQHVIQGQLTWRRHHGKSRLADNLEAQSTNIVLTTYHTVSAEWKSGSKTDQSIFFSTRWRRVVLDEAHFIRNTGSRMAKAICDIPCDVRWAVTGTPIQNRLSDLAALLQFLRVHPYDDPSRFEADITHLWKSQQAEEAVRRLKMLSRCLILRRPKATINLPLRTDFRYPVNFTPSERAVYENVKTQTLASMMEVTSSATDRVAPRFVNIIQQINQMRLICNLGLHYSSRHDNNNHSSSQTDWETTAQQAFNIQCEVTTLACELCEIPMNMTETLLEDTEATSKPLFSQCLRFFCSDCTRSMQQGTGRLTCGHKPSHSMAAVSLNRASLEEDATQTNLHGTSWPPSARLPSKVIALVRDLEYQLGSTKSVVFSTWRMTLDVVERGLKQAQIECLRFDGKVPQKDRKAILDKFRRDPNVKVLLLTLTCGAVGLTLTEASRAYLMEPHWNPTLEEQALARVHRLGQKKEVTTIRFFIRDTFEDRVMELQKKKEDLAGLLLDSQAGNSEHLERLCGLL